MADKNNYIMMLANTLIRELKIARNRVAVQENMDNIAAKIGTYSPETRGKIISHALAWGHTDETTTPPKKTSPYDVPPNDLVSVWGKDGNYVLNMYATRTVMAAMIDLVEAEK